jgi:TonB-linked SusC/RagA family outer membrane protein
MGLIGGGALVTPLRAQAAATVNGTVRSEAGAPLTAVTVAIPSIGIGTQTNAQGRYTLTVPAGRVPAQAVTLDARLVGFRRDTAQITLAAGATVTRDFTLAANPLRLTEVVVTGSGTSTTREKLGTSVSTVASEQIARATEANVVNALAAKATGVEVTSSAGDPGAGSGILIRGYKTIEGNGQPLFVVDGVPIDNSTIVSEFSDAEVSYSNRALDVNPNDIESVEILKGAAASSIYGLRAANGVVLITTKSGRAGQTRVTLSSVTTFDEVNRVIPLQRRFGRGNNGVASICAPSAACQLRSWGAELPAGTATFDHARDIFRTGNQFDNNLQISGGDANRTFFISGGAFDQNGIARGPNSALTRYSARLKATQALTSKLRVGGNVMYTDLRQQALQKGNNLNGLMLGATRQPPEYNPNPHKTEQGWQRAWSNPDPTQEPTIDNLIFDGPFWVANEQNNSSDVGRAIGGVNVDWSPAEWFTLAYSLGADYGSESRTVGLPPYSAGDAFTGQIYQGTNTTAIVDHNLLATLRRTFSPSVTGRLSLGQNLNSTRFESVLVKGTGFITPELFTLNNVVSSNLQPRNFESRTNIAGYFAQAETDLWDQLYLAAGVRADQSSTLSENNRTAFFPKGSVAWNVTNALGRRDQKGWLSYLKVRAAYGEVGRQPLPYQILTNLTSNAGVFAFGGGSTNPSQSGNGGLVTDSVRGDLDLKFERTKETEAGFDFGLFDQRLDGSVAFYNARSEDVIFGVTVAPTTGFTRAVQNGGSVRNRGWEVQLNARLLERPDYQWEVGVNWTRNRNRLLRLEGAEFVDVNGGFGVSRAVAGQPLGTFYADDFVRCRYGDDANFFDTSLGSNTDINAVCREANAPEGALFVNGNRLPIFDGRNTVIGDPNPNYLLGLRTGVTLFRKLRLSALVDIKNGGDVWNGTRLALQSYGTAKVTENRGNTYTFGKDVPGMPTGPVAGPGANEPVQIGFGWWRTGIGNNFNGPTSQGVEDGGFTRLREVSMAYSFDQPWVRRRLAVTSLDVRLAGRNLALWTDYSGVDPETNLTGPIGVGRGIDYFNSPNTRSWVVSVQVNR